MCASEAIDGGVRDLPQTEKQRKASKTVVRIPADGWITQPSKRYYVVFPATWTPGSRPLNRNRPPASGQLPRDQCPTCISVAQTHIRPEDRTRETTRHHGSRPRYQSCPLSINLIVKDVSIPHLWALHGPRKKAPVYACRVGHTTPTPWLRIAVNGALSPDSLGVGEKRAFGATADVAIASIHAFSGFYTSAPEILAGGISGPRTSRSRSPRASRFHHREA
ncbi:hypothetical protein K456DRAFT_33371 [Colletotrichum gloeosporioides 23]|nr:hypothetical protein K456DRAFT_33371 [Colletotrichum gloeosporioides 23]